MAWRYVLKGTLPLSPMPIEQGGSRSRLGVLEETRICCFFKASNHDTSVVLIC